jgi:uncharacterized protein (UPF0333 family)
MFKKLLKNKKAQQTAEYALLISLVVAAVIAMQTYAQRTIQARIRDASAYLTDQTSALGATNQYEPYYLETNYNVIRDDATTEIQSQRADNSGLFQMEEISDRTRGAAGYQQSSYDTGFGLINGL